MTSKLRPDLKRKDFHLVADWDYIYKKLRKFPNNVKLRIKRDITLLRNNPTKGSNTKMIDRFKTARLYKRRYGEIELYYIVETNYVVVLRIQYVGEVEILGIEAGIKAGKYVKKSTTKQKRTIKQYKEKFQNKITNK